MIWKTCDVTDAGVRIAIHTGQVFIEFGDSKTVTSWGGRAQFKAAAVQLLRKAGIETKR